MKLLLTKFFDLERFIAYKIVMPLIIKDADKIWNDEGKLWSYGGKKYGIVVINREEK